MILRIAAIVLLSASLSGLANAGPKPGGGPHGGGPHVGMRHAMPRGLAARSITHPRPHFAPRARLAARPAFRGRAAFARGGWRGGAARALNRPAMQRRAVSRNLARGPALSNRASAGAARQTLRSAPARAHANARNAASAFALRAFSGSTARAQAARLFGNPAFARHRFDPAFFGRARFAGAFWPGPYFWPYAYYDETFWLWPSAYDEVFWSYGYDDVLRGIYSPYAFSDYDEFLEGVGRPVRRARHQVAPRSFAELCGETAPGLTDWPIDRIVAAVEPNEQQRALLDALIRASDKAADGLRAACPRTVPVTPIGRIEASEKQLSALEEAVRTVRPALEKFYGSLTDDQKQRFNALAPGSSAARGRVRGVTAPQPDRLARACQETASADWPISRIEQAVRPDERQRAALDELRSATTQAARIVQSACPTDLPLTPTGRLAAMEQRIDALRQAVQTLRPALAKFYAALNDEQKARFNRALSDDRRTG